MSTAGVRFRDPSGNIIFDGVSTIARFLGARTIAAGSSGSLSNSELAHGIPFAIVNPTVTPDETHHQFPTLAFSGTSMTWATGQFGAHVVYGVYPNAVSTGVPPDTAGMRFYNANGVTIIDGQNSNLFYHSKHAISLDASGFNSSGLTAWATASFTITATHPVMAYRGSSMVAVLAMVNNGDGTWTVTICNYMNAAANGYVFVFDVATASPNYYSGDVGLRLRDSSGAVIFDSRKGACNVIGHGAYVITPPAYPDISTLGQDNLAVVLNSMSFSAYSDTETSSFSSALGGGGGGSHVIEYVYLTGAGVDGTTLMTGGIGVLYTQADPPEGTTSSWGYDQYLLVDVSKF